MFQRTKGHSLTRKFMALACALAILLGGCAPPASPTPTATPSPAVTATAAPTATAVPTPSATLHSRSPDGEVRVTFTLVDGVPYYSVDHGDRAVIRPSRLGLTLNDGPSLDRDLALVAHEQRAFDETWTQPWGEVKEIRDHYNELRVALKTRGDTPRELTLVFRAYDDGVGFRYEIPRQPHLADFEIADERTEFVLTDDHRAWWIPAYEPNRYEYLYRETPLSFLTTRSVAAVHTPLTMETADGLVLSLHEAALTDYAAMTLVGQPDHTLACDLVPWSDGVKVRGTAPHRSPWRTLQIGTSPGDLVTSYLILNLNEPNRLEDVTWIEPAKYIGIWWGMHIDAYSWGSGPKHGATTENALRYIDFAAEHGFEGVLIEGWNLGWDGDWTQHGERFDFTTPYPDFDIAEVTAYAASKGVDVIGHHETGAAVANYEAQMDEAFALYRGLGIDTVKTGYVGWGQGIKRYDDEGQLVGLEWHHGQYMVRHYRRVVEAAARYQIMLNVHEPIKPTGIRRTYPNMLTREGARGQEYNAWDSEGGNPPEHTTLLPFTRMLAGPFDFTPGIFDLRFEAARPDNRVNTTLAKQLALYVVIYSPLQMAADLPENYEGHPAFRFIEEVPVDWHTTQVLHAAIGDYVTIVRRERDGDDWYLGSITDEAGRTLEAPLTFLEPDRAYVAEIYADAAAADWETNPQAIDIREVPVDHETVLTLTLAPGGGQAIRFRPAARE